MGGDMDLRKRNLFDSIIQIVFIALLIISAFISPVQAQLSDSNVITSAEDAFGTAVGSDSVGLYDAQGIRGFSPIAAGNIRIQGLYFDRQSYVTDRVKSDSTVRVGIAAQGYPFPAPTGIVDINLSDRNQPLSLTSRYAQFGSRGFEFDTSVPLVRNELTTTASTALFDEHYGDGSVGTELTLGIVPRWTPSDSLQLTGFWGRVYTKNQTTAPIYETAGDFIPPRVPRGSALGPDWAKSQNTGDNLGIIGTFSLDAATTFRFGLFNSSFKSDRNFSNIVLDVTPEGIGRTLIIADPVHHFESTSGEGRLSRILTQRSLSHLFLLSFRWRKISSLYGGSDYFDEGLASINTRPEVGKPEFIFGPRTRERRHQEIVGIAYGLQIGKLIEFSAGLQNTAFGKTIEQPDLPNSRLADRAWMPNSTLALNLNKTLTIYGSYTSGIEDGGISPETTVNRSQPLPALKTRQEDFGIRYALSSNSRLIAGYFKIVKPHFTTDTNNFYRPLGEEKHAGLELSFLSTPIDGLTIVAGSVLSKSTTTGQATTIDAQGSTPIAQPRFIGQFNADYSLPFASNISIDSSFDFTASQVGTDNNAVRLPASTVFSIGSHLKFTLLGTRCTMRASISNVTNRFSWEVVSSRTYQPSSPRSISLSLTTLL
jgi:iron complex outermembrane receptor protein